MRNNVLFIACSSLVFTISTLSGCVTLTPQQEAQIQANANRKVTCTKGADCDVKWGRAITWISQNSHWKIQMQNDHMIQTYTSVGNSPYSGFLVNKVPVDSEMFEIQIASGCASMFGCIPNEMTSRALFNNFLIGPAAPVAAVSGVPSQQKP